MIDRAHRRGLLLLLPWLLVTAPAAAQDDDEGGDDVLWEEDDPSVPLREALRSMDPPLPCLVADTEVAPSVSGKTVRAVLATEGCEDGVRRDDAGNAPVDQGVYAKVLRAARTFIAEQSIEGATEVEVEFAAHGWHADIDLARYDATDGLPEQKMRAATTWTPVAKGVVVRAPPDLLARWEAARQPTETTALDQDSIQQVIRRKLPAIRYCAQKREEEVGVAPRGKVEVRFTITPHGKVVDLELVDSPFDPVVDRCLLDRFGELTFPASGDTIQITWPVKFD